MVELITSLDQIQEFIKIIRLYRNGFITNFYLDTFKHNLWIEEKSLFYVKKGETIFLIHKNKDFNILFFIATNMEELDKSLFLMDSCLSERIVVDIVGNESILSQKNFLLSHGFFLYNSLHRMSRTGAFEVEKYDGNVITAIEDDIDVLYQLLQKYFDPLGEQLPSKKELRRWIGVKSILLIKKEGLIVGFLIYELIGFTLYLRYWFVHPNYRNQKIGSELFLKFMYEGRHTKRQLFWVINSNKNAIKRYKHYGFASEKMYDYVLVKNK